MSAASPGRGEIAGILMRHFSTTIFMRTCRVLVGLILVLGLSLAAGCSIPWLNADPGSDSPPAQEKREPAGDESPMSDDADVPFNSEQSSDFAPDDASVPDGATDDTAPGTPVRIVEGSVQEPRTLNPVLVGDPLSEEISRLVFSGLTSLDVDNAEPVPDLAEDWEISDDGTTYTFTLRDDVEWHDGQPFTAQDVVFTYELIMDDRTRSPRYSRTVERVVAVEATGNHTVEFRLVAPYAPFLSTIATFGIVPQHLLAEVLPDELVTNPFGISSAIGTGPFELSRWDRGERLLFDVNRNHHGGVAAFDQYEYQIVPNASELLEGLSHRSIDWARISPESFDDADQLDGVRAVSLQSYEMVTVMLQQDSGKTDLFADAAVRQAMMLALDREHAVSEIWDGHAEVAHETIPPASWAHQESEVRYEFDVARANELLTEAGWVMSDDGIRLRNGRPLQFSVIANGDNPIRRELAEWLVESWQEIGIDVRPQFETWGSLRDRVTTSREFDSLVLGYRWETDPDQHAMWSSDSIADAFNLGSYVNLEVDSLLSEALQATDPEERARLYQEAQNLVLADLPALPIAFPNQTIAIGERLRDVEVTAILLRNRAGVADWVPDEIDENGN